MNIWLIFILLFEFSACVVSLLNLKSNNQQRLKGFSYFLMFVFLGELLGLFIAQNFQNNVFYYNVFISIQFVYYLMLIKQNIYSLKAKKGLIATVIFYGTFTIINGLFIQNIYKELGSYNFTLGCFLIVIWMVYFFYELLQSDSIENYLAYPFFWIGLGLFIFYVGSIPYMSVYNYLSVNYKKIFKAYFIIIEFLNYLMYSFFIIGMLCNNKKK